MKQGFYKNDEGMLLYSELGVRNKNYLLLPKEKDNHDYPVDGWIWFDSLEEACEAFDMDINNYIEEDVV